jgi:hypothetical protein
MSKKLIFLVILSLIIGGLFYFLFIWEVPKKPEQETSGPTLFAKEDYKIDERENGKYIVVEKVGLTCKVPENWDIKIEGDDYPEPEYWVNLSSPDAEFTSILLTKGCEIAIAAGTTEIQIKEIKDSIKFVENNQKNSEICSIILGTSECGEHIFKKIEISEYRALEHIIPTSELFGESIAINIPINEKNMIGIEGTFSEEYKEQCSPVWEEFIKNIIIE